MKTLKKNLYYQMAFATGVALTHGLINNAYADDESEVLRAQAYIALGDVLNNMAQDDGDKLAAAIGKSGVQTGANGSTGFGYTADQQKILNDYNALSQQAATMYERVFGQDYGFSNGENFKLPVGYVFLKRDAYEKWSNLKNGFQVGAYRRRGANLYAVNADFKGDIVAKTSSIVSELQRLDTEARRLQNEFNTFRVSQSDASGNAIGLQASELQSQNYSLNVQTQLKQYQGQSKSLQLQLDDEVDTIRARDAVVKSARDVLVTNWNNLMDLNASAANPQIFEVNANNNLPTSTLTNLNAGDLVFIQATDKWKAVGAARQDCMAGGKETLCYHPYTGTQPSGTFYYYTTVSFDDPANFTSLASYPSLDTTTISPFIQAMGSGNIDSDANGIYVSTSDSVAASYGTSTSTGVNGGLSFNIYGVTIGGGASEGWGESSGDSRSRGQSVTIGLKSQGADLESANLGALIGRFVGPGLTAEQQQWFVVGSNTTIQVPKTAQTDSNNHVTLYLMQNDISGHHAAGGGYAGNSGVMRVRVTPSVQFKNLVPAFWDWFNKGCDQTSTGELKNCGFKTIADNIAYETNPQLIAQTALKDFENTYPTQPLDATYTSALSGAVDSVVSLAMANRDYKLALLQSEVTQTARDTALASIDLSNQAIEKTKTLVALIQRQQVNQRTTSALIAAGAQFYEDELANMDNLRSYLIARLKRYMQIAYDSYNYRYLDNFKIQGSPQPGHEGDFYYQALQALLDRSSDDDVINDVSNPNRGYLVHQFSDQEIASLKATGEVNFSLKPSDFYCKGYGLEDQVRVHIEKVGFLLDIDPVNEQSFFQNSPNSRRVAFRTTHGNLNTNLDLNTNVVEYYLPSQSKDIYGYSSRVLTNYHSDYAELGDSNLFQRRSFQNTSYVTDWNVKLINHEKYDLEHLLNGVKFVIYFSSVEANNNASLATCTDDNNPPGRTVQRGYWK